MPRQRDRGRPTALEAELDRSLEDPRGAGRRYLAKLGIGQLRVGVAKIGVVEHVESLEAKIQRHVFMDRKGARNLRIEAEGAGPAESVPADSSVGAERR